MFTRETTHIARKPHRCDGCRQVIAPGESYVRWAGLTDGDFGTAAYHPDCRAWEILLNRQASLNSDEWCPLHEFVAEDRASLEGAPESVRAQFARVAA